MTNTKTERPRHLKVLGTRIAESDQRGFKREFHELLAEVPLEWDFGSAAGEALLTRIHERVEGGETIEALAQEVAMEALVPLYREWVKDRG